MHFNSGVDVISVENSRHGTPRRWLLLSHGFNMDGRAASLTVTDKIPHLIANGIEPVVLSSATGAQDERFDHHRLLPWGPSALRFDLRHLIALHMGRGLRYRALTLLASIVLTPFMFLERLAFGLRSHWSWALPAFVRGAWRLRRGDIELVYSSGGAYSAHLAGWWLKRWTKTRWIVEVHDPLVFPGRPLRNRDDRFQARLERLICRNADAVWWFTEGALAAARVRHPELGARGFALLPGAAPPIRQARYEQGPVCVMGHFGSLARQRSLTPVLDALALLLHRCPETRRTLRLEVYGSELDAEAARQCQQLGLEDIVTVAGRLEHDPTTGLSGRERVHIRMQQLDVLLMLHGEGPECAEYIPSKLYDYFWARRPVLGLTRDNLQLDALLLAHGSWAVRSDDTHAVAQAIEQVLARWRGKDLPDVSEPPIGVDHAVDAILRVVDPMSPGPHPGKH